jgi:SOS-response transcriptional repressor LexA
MQQNMPPGPSLAPKGASYIPLLKNPATYSFLSTPEKEIISYISLPKTPEDSFAIEYTGDFMSPTIRDGDIVVIAPGNTPTPGNIALIMGQWGEPFLRRFRSRNGEVFFTADNSAYSPFKPDSATTILGIVAAVWRKVNL